MNHPKSQRTSSHLADINKIKSNLASFKMNNAKFVPNGLSPQRYVDRLGEAKTSWAAKRQDMINGLTSQSGKAVESTVNDAAATVKAADQLRGQLDSLTNVTDFNFVNLHHVDQASSVHADKVDAAAVAAREVDDVEHGGVEISDPRGVAELSKGVRVMHKFLCVTGEEIS